MKNLKNLYEKQFPSYDEAFDWMQMKNKSAERAGNKNDIYCLTIGNEGDNYAVVDLDTAIDLDFGYVVSTNGWVNNPFIKGE